MSFVKQGMSTILEGLRSGLERRMIWGLDYLQCLLDDFTSSDMLIGNNRMEEHVMNMDKKLD